MIDREYYGTDDPRQLRRFFAVAATTGLFLAYSALIPLKCYGLMPDHMSWPKLLLVPTVQFGILAWIAWAPAVFPTRPRAGLILGLCLVVAVMVVVMLLS